MSQDPTFNAVRSDFIEKTGVTSQAEGLPRIAGRLFGLLIFDGDMVSFGDLATRLQVSRASISSSIRLLEERGLVKRMSRPGERQDYFQLAPNPYATMLQGIQKRNQTTREDIVETIRALPEGAEATHRLAAYADFYSSLDAAVTVALDALNAAPPATLGTEPKDQSDDR